MKKGIMIFVLSLFLVPSGVWASLCPVGMKACPKDCCAFSQVRTSQLKTACHLEGAPCCQYHEESQNPVLLKTFSKDVPDQGKSFVTTDLNAFQASLAPHLSKADERQKIFYPLFVFKQSFRL